MNSYQLNTEFQKCFIYNEFFSIDATQTGIALLHSLRKTPMEDILYRAPRHVLPKLISYQYCVLLRNYFGTILLHFQCSSWLYYCWPSKNVFLSSYNNYYPLNFTTLKKDGSYRWLKYKICLKRDVMYQFPCMLVKQSLLFIIVFARFHSSSGVCCASPRERGKWKSRWQGREKRNEVWHS